MARNGLLLLSLLLAPVVQAAPDARARQEIAALIAGMDSSGCRFQRNGSWHDAGQARAHLQRKYEYLLKKNIVDSAEQFIERAASRSSMSGRAYRIQCPAQAEQEASAWFTARLQQLRQRTP